MTRARTPLSRKKLWQFRVAALLIAYVACELIALAAICWFHGGPAAVHETMDREARGLPLMTRTDETDEVLHPFSGFVRRPPTDTNGQTGMRVTNFGFVDDELPIHRRSDDRLIIAIAGGSVAEDLGMNFSHVLERELKKSPRFEGKRIVFVRLGLSGYKQPQQLMAISYLMTLGAEFDCVINLDGFNEIVLPIVENKPGGVFPSFPRIWQARVTETSDIGVMRMIGRISYLRGRSQSWAKLLGAPPARYSPVLNLLWTAIHSQLQQQTNSEFSQLNELRSKDHDYAVTGPKIALGDDTEYYAHCAAVWSRSSEQLHQLCAANGVRYFHFLQPNQYVAGSRPAMSDDERRLIYHEHYSAKAPVEQGYPLLQLEGERLASRGVPFFDLTGLFVDQSERIYRDHCCHFTDLGNEILATRIGEIVLERIAGDR